MNRVIKFIVNIIGCGLFVLLLVLISTGCSGDNKNQSSTEMTSTEKPGTASTSSAEEGQTEIDVPEPIMAPDFELPRLAGGTLRLSDYRGSIVLLDFWATWCGPCRMTIPHLVKLQEEMGSEGLVVIGVDLDQGTPEGVRQLVDKFVNEYKMNYPVVLGDADIVALYGNFVNIPVSFLINQKGEIVERHVGFRPRQVYEASIRELLEETEAAR